MLTRLVLTTTAVSALAVFGIAPVSTASAAGGGAPSTMSATAGDVHGWD